MKKIKLCLGILLSVFSIFIETCYSVIVADIEDISKENFSHRVRKADTILLNGNEDPFSKKNEREHIDVFYKVRVLFFDVDNQHFIDYFGDFPGKIYYVSLPKNGNSLRFPDWFLLSYKDKKLKVDFTPYKKNQKQDVIIRTNGFIVNSPNKAKIKKLSLLDETRLNAKFIYLPSNKQKKISLDIFDDKDKRRKDTNKYLSADYTFFDSLDNYKFKMSKKSYLISQDQGSVGEIAIDVTMQALDFIKKNGKYKEESDNGFDGVYYKKEPETLLLSESKFWKTPPTIEHIKRELFINIDNRLNNIDNYGSEKQKETGKFIRTFIKKEPDNLFLLPYIIIGDGSIKCESITLKNAQKEIEIVKEETILLTPKSPENEKKKALTSLITQTQISLEDSLKYAFEAFNMKISSNDQKSILKTLEKYNKKDSINKNLLEEFEKSKNIKIENKTSSNTNSKSESGNEKSEDDSE